MSNWIERLICKLCPGLISRKEVENRILESEQRLYGTINKVLSRFRCLEAELGKSISTSFENAKNQITSLALDIRELERVIETMEDDIQYDINHLESAIDRMEYDIEDLRN